MTGLDWTGMGLAVGFFRRAWKAWNYCGAVPWYHTGTYMGTFLPGWGHGRGDERGGRRRLERDTRSQGFSETSFDRQVQDDNVCNYVLMWARG